MNDLRDAVRALRREVESALMDDRPLPAGARLEAEKITATLGLVVLQPAGPAAQPGGEGSKGRWAVALPGSGVQHTLLLQFRVQRPVLEPNSAAQNSPERGPDLTAGDTRAARIDRIAEQCVEAFGPPGFDNAARAEVFCEMALGVPMADLCEALEFAGTEASASPDSPLGRQISRLRQVLGFAPVGPKRASELLRRLLEDVSVAELLGVLRERWRFGTHWTLRETITNPSGGNP